MSRRTLPAIALIVLVTAVAYARTFDNWFAWDDGYIVLDNPAIQDLANIPNLFVKPWAAGTTNDLGARQNAPYFRPLALASMALDWAIAGPDPVVFHATNLLLHLASALFFWGWLRRLLGRGKDDPGPAGDRGPLLALIGALLWAVHPVHSEAVDVVTYRTTLLSGLAMFASLRLLTPAARLDRFGTTETTAAAIAAGAACFAAGLLAKETTLILPALLIIFDTILGRMSWRRVATVYVPLVAVAAAWWVVRSGITGANIYTWFDGLTAWQTTLMVPRIFFLYVRLALLPWPLCPFYDWNVLGAPESVLEPDIFVGALLMLTMAAAIPLLARRVPLAAFGLAWAFTALLPVSHLMPFFDAAGDRFLYVPLAGWIIAILGIAAALPATPVLRGIGLFLPMVAIVSFGIVTTIRTGDWHDSETVLKASIRDFPESVSAHLGLGRLYLESHRSVEAIPELRAAALGAPSLAIAVALLAVAEGRSGDIAEARRTLRDAPMPEHGLPSAVEIARSELGQAGEFELMRRMGL